MHKPLGSDKFRFLAGGILNTALSYGIYLMLQVFFEYRLAYTIAFVAGIVSGYAINTWWVFRQPWSWRAIVAYPAVPVASYFASLVIVHVAVEWLGVDQRIAPLLATAVMLPATFLLTRMLITHLGRGSAARTD